MINLHYSTLILVIGVSVFAGATVTALVTTPPTIGMMAGFVICIVGVALEPPGKRKW